MLLLYIKIITIRILKNKKYNYYKNFKKYVGISKERKIIIVAYYLRISKF
jgi:hypothetical protein